MNETPACTGSPYTYEYCAEIPAPGFTATQGQAYWLVIHAELDSYMSEFWGWMPSTDANGCWAQYVWPLVGYDTWQYATNPAMAFTLYAESSGPSATPTRTPTATRTPTVTPTPTPTVPPPIPTGGPAGLVLLASLFTAFLLRRR